MNKQQTLDAIYGCLVALRFSHPHGLRALGDANAQHVLTRFGVDGQVAEMCSVSLEVLGGLGNPMELIELVADQIQADGTLVDPFTYLCTGVACGQKDETGLFTHPQKLFTAVNCNGRRYGIESDASASPGGGLSYYQDWRDADEVLASGVRILTCWDARDGRCLTDAEIVALFHAGN